MRYHRAVERIKRVRKRMGLSLAELAERAGVHRMALARMERPGEDVRASTLAALAKALGVPACELFDEPSVRTATAHSRAVANRGRKAKLT